MDEQSRAVHWATGAPGPLARGGAGADRWKWWASRSGPVKAESTSNAADPGGPALANSIPLIRASQFFTVRPNENRRNAGPALLREATAVALFVRRFRIPYTVALVLVELGMGCAHLVSPPRLTPRTRVVHLLLPGLLFEACISPRSVRLALGMAQRGAPGSSRRRDLHLHRRGPHDLFGLRAAGMDGGASWRTLLVFGGLVAATESRGRHRPVPATGSADATSHADRSRESVQRWYRGRPPLNSADVRLRCIANQRGAVSSFSSPAEAWPLDSP